MYRLKEAHIEKKFGSNVKSRILEFDASVKVCGERI